MSLFPTKFVADVDTLTIASADTLEAVLKVDGTVVLREQYSPALGEITVRGLRNVLEAAIYGNLGGEQDRAAALVELTVGRTVITPPGGYLFASRLRNPRDPEGLKTVMAAGDLVAVAAGGRLVTPAVYTRISGTAVMVEQVAAGSGATAIGDGLTLWVEQAACAEQAVCVRFLNRYDVPQTMMTPVPLEIKPGFEDQTALMGGRRMRFSVTQNDEYTLRSGVIHSELEYASWNDLVTSRRAEVLTGGQWLPVIVTKANYTQTRRSAGRNRVEITFRMSDQKQGL